MITNIPRHYRQIQCCRAKLPLNPAAGSDEEYYCTSTLPSQFASVQQPNSRCMRVPPPPPLPDGTQGFVPAVRVVQLVCQCSV